MNIYILVESIEDGQTMTSSDEVLMLFDNLSAAKEQLRMHRGEDIGDFFNYRIIVRELNSKAVDIKTTDPIKNIVIK